jgi:hypothetical protein
MKDSVVVADDVDVLLRRGELSSEQRQTSERRLKEAPLSELAYRVGVAFDRIANVHDGDEERVRRCVERALQTQRLARAPRRRGFALWLSAALVLVTTSGFAWWGQKGMVRRHASAFFMTSAFEPRFARVLRPVMTSSVPRLVPSILAVDAVPGETTNAPAAPVSVRSEQAVAPSAAAEPLPPTASELLSRANAARGKGRFAEASELYRQLQREFPRSAEGRLSRVSLGRIWLARGQAASALLEFEKYLESGGPLDEEALVGKAHALGALGRTGEEQATYRELVRRFPRSVYTTEARARLGVDAGEP